ncbi:helix-turn-helix domain-containing protein [Streptomyces fradiae]|uniref:MerR family transcriptional regulator n=1 Tax=Streptomyces fradiae TaxID=1906 RepID=UPI0035193895
MDALLTIGDFARATGLTPKALRRYDELGLLRPARVDPFSGYRYYAGEQVERARLVGWLRRIGMPLAEIGRVCARYETDPAVRPGRSVPPPLWPFAPSGRRPVPPPLWAYVPQGLGVPPGRSRRGRVGGHNGRRPLPGLGFRAWTFSPRAPRSWCG